MMSVSRNSITRLDASQFRRDAETGFLFAPVQPTRAGVFMYQDANGQTVRELRADEDVFDAASLATLENAVITNSHPPEMVTADNVEKYQVGNTYGTHGRADDGIHTRTDAVVRDAKAIADIDRGKQEVSCGYRCDIDETPGTHPKHGAYDRKQTNIRYNHLAIEWRGRAGSGARLRADSEGETPHLRFDAWQVETEITNEQEPIPMEKIKINGHEVEVSEAAKIAYEAEKTRVDSELNELNTKLKGVESEKEKVSGRVDALETELKEANQFRADSQLKELKEQAKVILKDDFKFDGLSALDVKKAAIKAKYPEKDLNNISDDRLDGMYEMVLEAVSAQPSASRTDSFTNANAIYQSAIRADADPIETARQAQITKMIEGRKSNV